MSLLYEVCHLFVTHRPHHFERTAYLAKTWHRSFRSLVLYVHDVEDVFLNHILLVGKSRIWFFTERGIYQNSCPPAYTTRGRKYSSQIWDVMSSAEFYCLNTFWWYFSLSVAHQQQQINKLLIRYHLDSTKIFAKHMYIVTWSIIGQSSNTEDYFRFRRSTEQVWRALRQSTSLYWYCLYTSGWWCSV
jgi:hypothetical protein